MKSVKENNHITLSKEYLENCGRNEIQKYLEDRGFAVYDCEETEDLREAALEDFLKYYDE